MQKNNLLEELFLAPPENIQAINDYFERREVTFFSWKLFGIKISKSGKIIFDYKFDTKNADKYLQPELKFLNFLKRNNIKYRYIKLIPDELPFYFWNQKTTVGSKKFSQEVKTFFSKYEPLTEVIRISELLNRTDIEKRYEEVFNKVYKNINKLVKKDKYLEEFQRRSTYYTKEPLDKKTTDELTKKAFALFAAETTILYELQKQKVLPNLVMLAGSRSIDTYKYEFFKYPDNRPILPKLFVI